MASRYDNIEISRNSSERDKKKMKKRGIKFVNQFRTPNISYPTEEEQAFLDSRTVVWKVGDRFYKMANKYYGDPTYWWVIAWFNQAPTESHVVVGTTLEVPLPLDRALAIYYRRNS
jgi:nucleoid-associated protein YgaU